MPTTYAHYKFGLEVLDTLEEREKEIIYKYLDIYNYGIYGPDIMYTYRLWDSKGLCRLGSKYHHEPFTLLLEYAKNKIKVVDDPEPYLAYMYGFICHFALDAYCHGYVNQMWDDRNMRHALVESEFDRMLMLEDGLNPLKHKPTKHMKPSKAMALIVGELFPEINEKIALEAMKTMKRYCNLISGPNFITRNLVYLVLKLTGNYASKESMIIRKEPAKESEICNADLYRMYKKAVPMAKNLIENYYENVFLDVPFTKVCNRKFSANHSLENEIDQDTKGDVSFVTRGVPI